MIGSAARRNRLPTDQATLRDLASEMEWAKVSNVRPDDYARVAAARGRPSRGVDAESVARVFASYEEVKRDQGRMDMEDVLLCAAALLAEDERVAARCAGSTSGSSSTSSRTSARSRPPCSTSGSAVATTSAWSATPPRRSTRSPAPTRRTSWTSRATTATRPRSSWSATTGRRRRWSRRPTGCCKGTASQGVQLRSQQETGPEVRFVEHSDEVAEAEQVAADVLATRRERDTPAREIAVLFRINAQSEAFEEALAARGVPYVVRGAARFFERAEVKQAVSLLRGGARSR